MSNEKVSGGPPGSSQGPPPPYNPSQNTPVMYSQHPSYQTQQVIVGQQIGPVPGSSFLYRNSPALIICQHCNVSGTTRLTYESGLLTWAACGIVALFGGIFGCCLIPFCINATKDVVHVCPSCGQMVGKFRQMS